MKKGYLSQYFTQVASKALSAVEADRHRSNQHEFDGVAALRTMLGQARRTYRARFVYLNDDDPEPVVDEGFLTWYDAREAHPRRSEWRLYFPPTRVSACATEGDLLVIGLRPDESLLVVIAEGGSTIANQVRWLFGFSDAPHPGYSLKGEVESDQLQIEFASRFILEQIGIEIEETAESYLEQMLARFGGGFPVTAEFSAFARSTVREITVNDDPDAVVIAWMDREELLFRTLEKHLLAERLRKGFDAADVDGFISFSLSVQNRRKSRAGFALENHLQHLFHSLGLRYSRTPRTEGRSKPDFLFPGEREYHRVTFPEVLLTMLGVKSSCKERWRQVLVEADRVPHKHLLTLEPGISTNQTDEMRVKQLQLVLPQSIHATYSATQREWLMPVSKFVGLVRERQAKADALVHRG
jgi:hypothetical protein